MAGKKSNINWLLKELPFLRENGIISEETAENLEKHYQAELEKVPSMQKIFSLIVGIIGIVMIAGGVILFLNHNWDMFPKAARIGIAAIPLFCGAVISYYTILNEKGVLWREASAVFTSTGAAVLAGVISQIYHIGGEFSDFMFMILLLSVIPLYLFRSIGLATLYACFTFSVSSWNPSDKWRILLIAALLLPFLIYYLREKSPYKVWCRYIAILNAIAFFSTSANNCGQLIAVIFIGVFLLGGTEIEERKEGFFRNPWLVPSYALSIIMLAAGSSSESFFKIGDHQWYSFAVMGVGLAFFGTMFYRNRKKVESYWCLLFIILTAGGFADENFVMRIIYNVFMGLSGIAFMRNGFVYKSFARFNIGALMICVLVACRFFDTDIGLLYRSLGFILLGSGFVVANVIFARRSKEVKNEEA